MTWWQAILGILLLDGVIMIIDALQRSGRRKKANRAYDQFKGTNNIR